MRFFTPSRLRRLRCAVLAALAAGPFTAAWAAECVGQRGGDLVVTGSDHCLGQMRRDPALRRQVVQAIDVGAAPATTNASHATATGRSTGPARANLAHPLSRISQLNAQSRYLWSLGNPAPTYYGQVQTAAR